MERAMEAAGKKEGGVPVETFKARAGMKPLKGFAKFCYGMAIFLRVLAVALGLANILYIVFFSKDALGIVLLPITFGFPYGLSFLPATVYFISAAG